MVATAAETEPRTTPARRAIFIAVSTTDGRRRKLPVDQRQIRSVQSYRKASPKFPGDLLTMSGPSTTGRRAHAGPGADVAGSAAEVIACRSDCRSPTTPGPAGPARLGRDLATVARTADEAGFDFISVMDHFFQIALHRPARARDARGLHHAGLPGRPAPSRAKLVTLVTGAVYRHPGILAKIVTTLDVLSGGRAWLGIGAAWNEEESRGLGHPVPAGRRAVRAAGGDAADLPADVARRPGPLPRQALPAGAAAQLAAGPVPAAPADPDRRLGRAEDAAVRGPLRPGVQPVPRPRSRPQARRAARALRRRGPRLRRDPSRPATSSSTSGEKGEKAGRGRRPAAARWPRWDSRPRSARSRGSGSCPRSRSSAAR